MVMLVISTLSVTALTEITSCGTSTSDYAGETEFTIPIDGLDCSDGTSHGIIIDTDDVTLDCGDAQIVGSVDSVNYGVRLYQVNDVTIQNCVVENFDNSIVLLNSNYILIDSNELKNSVGEGVYINRGGFVNITSNEIESSGAEGIYVLSDSNIVLGNTITLSGSDGVVINDGESNFFQDNIVSYSGDEAFEIHGSMNNQFYGNVISESSSTGVSIHSSDNNEFVGNTLINLGHHGFSISHSVGNVFNDLNISSSIQNGFSFNDVNDSSFSLINVIDSGSRGISLTLSSSNSFDEIYVSNSDSYVLYLVSSDNNDFTNMQFSENEREIYFYQSENNDLSSTISCDSFDSSDFYCLADVGSGGENYFANEMPASNKCGNSWPALDTDYYLCSDDSDGDGCTNEEELSLGTDPQDGSSYHRSCESFSMVSVYSDISGDGSVDESDITAFNDEITASYGSSYTGAADMNGDGVLTFADMLDFVRNYVAEASSSQKKLKYY